MNHLKFKFQLNRSKIVSLVDVLINGVTLGRFVTNYLNIIAQFLTKSLTLTQLSVKKLIDTQKQRRCVMVI